MAKETTGKGYSALFALAFLSGLLFFIALLQADSPLKYLSLAGILGSSAVIAYEISSFHDLARIFDIRRLSANAYYYAAISILMGTLWALVFRDYLHIQLLPARITTFALIAMMIGSAEELVFRGYIQQKLRHIGMIVSILGASALHTFYKCFIFMILPPVHFTDYYELTFWTLTMGCLLGVLKEYSHTTLVPLAGHATFDLITYGDGVIDSWWVWL